MKELQKRMILEGVADTNFDMFEDADGRWHFSYTDPEDGSRETQKARARYLGSQSTSTWVKGAQFFIWKAQQKIARAQKKKVLA